MIFLHAAEGLDGGGEQKGQAACKPCGCRIYGEPAPSPCRAGALRHRHGCRTTLTSSAVLVQRLWESKRESKHCKHTECSNPLLSVNLSLKCLVSSKVLLQVTVAVPSCHDPGKASDALVTFVSRSQFYELGKCVSYSSSFEHSSGDSSGRQPYTAAVFWDSSRGFFRLGCLSQGVEFVLDGILPGNAVVGQVPSSVPGLETTGSRKQWEAAKQGSHT